MTAAEIIAYREKHGLSRADLARELGVSRVAVHYWETEQRRMSAPVVKLMQRLGE